MTFKETIQRLDRVSADLASLQAIVQSIVDQAQKENPSILTKRS